MFIYQNFTYRSYFYTSIHGCYGLIWFLKSQFYFPDPSFSRPVSLGSLIIYGLGLMNYYLIPYTTISSIYSHDIEKGRVLVCLLMFIMGSFFMVGSDA